MNTKSRRNRGMLSDPSPEYISPALIALVAKHAPGELDLFKSLFSKKARDYRNLAKDMNELLQRQLSDRTAKRPQTAPILQKSPTVSSRKSASSVLASPNKRLSIPSPLPEESPTATASFPQAKSLKRDTSLVTKKDFVLTTSDLSRPSTASPKKDKAASPKIASPKKDIWAASPKKDSSPRKEFCSVCSRKDSAVSPKSNLPLSPGTGDISRSNSATSWRQVSQKEPGNPREKKERVTEKKVKHFENADSDQVRGKSQKPENEKEATSYKERVRQFDQRRRSKMRLATSRTKEYKPPWDFDITGRSFEGVGPWFGSPKTKQHELGLPSSTDMDNVPKIVELELDNTDKSGDFGAALRYFRSSILELTPAGDHGNGIRELNGDGITGKHKTKRKEPVIRKASWKSGGYFARRSRKSLSSLGLLPRSRRQLVSEFPRKGYKKQGKMQTGPKHAEDGSHIKKPTFTGPSERLGGDTMTSSKRKQLKNSIPKNETVVNKGSGIKTLSSVKGGQKGKEKEDMAANRIPSHRNSPTVQDNKRRQLYESDYQGTQKNYLPLIKNLAQQLVYRVDAACISGVLNEGIEICFEGSRYQENNTTEQLVSDSPMPASPCSHMAEEIVLSEAILQTAKEKPDLTESEQAGITGEIQAATNEVKETIEVATPSSVDSPEEPTKKIYLPAIENTDNKLSRSSPDIFQIKLPNVDRLKRDKKEDVHGHQHKIRKDPWSIPSKDPLSVINIYTQYKEQKSSSGVQIFELEDEAMTKTASKCTVKEFSEHKKTEDKEFYTHESTDTNMTSRGSHISYPSRKSYKKATTALWRRLSVEVKKLKRIRKSWKHALHLTTEGENVLLGKQLKNNKPLQKEMPPSTLHKTWTSASSEGGDDPDYLPGYANHKEVAQQFENRRKQEVDTFHKLKRRKRRIASMLDKEVHRIDYLEKNIMRKREEAEHWRLKWRRHLLETELKRLDEEIYETRIRIEKKMYFQTQHPSHSDTLSHHDLSFPTFVERPHSNQQLRIIPSFKGSESTVDTTNYSDSFVSDHEGGWSPSEDRYGAGGFIQPESSSTTLVVGVPLRQLQSPFKARISSLTLCEENDGVHTVSEEEIDAKSEDHVDTIQDTVNQDSNAKMLATAIDVNNNTEMAATWKQESSNVELETTKIQESSNIQMPVTGGQDSINVGLLVTGRQDNEVESVESSISGDTQVYSEEAFLPDDQPGKESEQPSTVYGGEMMHLEDETGRLSALEACHASWTFNEENEEATVQDDVLEGLELLNKAGLGEMGTVNTGLALHEAGPEPTTDEVSDELLYKTEGDETAIPARVSPEDGTMENASIQEVSMECVLKPEALKKTEGAETPVGDGGTVEIACERGILKHTQEEAGMEFVSMFKNPTFTDTASRQLTNEAEEGLSETSTNIEGRGDIFMLPERVPHEDFKVIPESLNKILKDETAWSFSSRTSICSEEGDHGDETDGSPHIQQALKGDKINSLPLAGMVTRVANEHRTADGHPSVSLSKEENQQDNMDNVIKEFVSGENTMEDANNEEEQEQEENNKNTLVSEGDDHTRPESSEGEMSPPDGGKDGFQNMVPTLAVSESSSRQEISSPSAAGKPQGQGTGPTRPVTTNSFQKSSTSKKQMLEDLVSIEEDDIPEEISIEENGVDLSSDGYERDLSCIRAAFHGFRNDECESTRKEFVSLSREYAGVQVAERRMDEELVKFGKRQMGMSSAIFADILQIDSVVVQAPVAIVTTPTLKTKADRLVPFRKRLSSSGDPIKKRRGKAQPPRFELKTTVSTAYSISKEYVQEFVSRFLHLYLSTRCFFSVLDTSMQEHRGYGEYSVFNRILYDCMDEYMAKPRLEYVGTELATANVMNLVEYSHKVGGISSMEDEGPEDVSVATDVCDDILNELLEEFIWEGF